MDIANYLSELLNRYNEVSVPGLGCFSRVRINGYYNDAEGTFYPPRYQLHFDQQEKDDEILVNYIAEKKKISLASSKYFTEKYINTLRQELALHQVPFAELGWFYTIERSVAFKPNINYNNDAPFYGLPPVKLNKLNYREAVKPSPVYIPWQAPAPVAEQPAAAALESEPVPAASETGYINDDVVVIAEDYEVRNGISIWVIILVIIIIIASAALTVYKFNPGLFGLGQPVQKPDTQMQAVKPPVAVDTFKTDTPVAGTPVKTIAGADSALNKANADTSAKPEYVIFLDSFKTRSKGDEVVKTYIAAGVDARLLGGPGTGPRVKIIAGHFATYADGEAERKKLLASKKIHKNSYTQQINTRK